MNLFDFFNEEEDVEVKEAKAEAKAEAKSEAKAEAKAEPKTEAKENIIDVNDTDDELEDGVDVEETEKDDEASKKSDGKKPTSSSKASKLNGPVKVVGNGWSYSYGESGKKYTPLQVLKAAYAAGYKEVAVNNVSLTTDDKSAIFVSTILMPAYSDSDQIGEKVSVEVGMNKAEYVTAECFDGAAADEVSALDLAKKWQENHIDFKGFSLAVDRSIEVAVPCLKNNSSSYKLNEGEEIILYRDGGSITTTVTSDFEQEFIDGYGKCSVTFYKPEDVVFAIVKGKTALNIKPSAIVGTDYKSVSSKAVEEVYKLPFVLTLPNLGIHKEMSASDFGGKEKVKKDDVIGFLKSQYTIFSSQSREVFVDYEKSVNVVSVMIAAGKKG